MSAKKITLRIGKRDYPLEISKGEEESIQLAAKMINENIDKLKGNYHVTDYVDLLAMTALEMASNGKGLTDIKESAYNNLINSELRSLGDRIDQVLESDERS
jgi:cell division protein ZapA (FtsZ GTPase activity inhibitor)